MRLQWSEVRARAAVFAEAHNNARYEKGETQTFYNEFFDCFGVNRRQVANYEQRVRNLPGDKQRFIRSFLAEHVDRRTEVGRARPQEGEQPGA